MTYPRRAAIVYDTVAQLQASFGPATERYSVVVERDALYKWVPNNVDAHDGTSTIGHTGGYEGRWKQQGVVLVDKGTDLTNADQTLTWSASSQWRVLPAATLTANRTKTLSASGASNGSHLTITRNDVTAFTVDVVNGGAGAGTLFTFPAGVKFFASFYFDGTNWLLRAAGQMEFLP